MLKRIQAGSGPLRALVVSYFTADHGALIRSLPSSACILVDIDNPGGRFAKPVGHGGVQTIEEAERLAKEGEDFEVSSLVLVGFSAGCQAPRSQLMAGATPDVVLCLDGISGSMPPAEAQIAPWRALVDRARRGEACFVVTHTSMTYVERLAPAQRYASTTRLARMLTGTVGAEPPAEGTIPPIEGDLYVLAYPSADIDGPAHLRQQNKVMPDVLQRIVTPFLEGRKHDTTPMPTPSSCQPQTPTLHRGSKGPAVVEWQRALAAAGFSPGAVDGDYGYRTEAATKAFQKAHSLPISGVVDEPTRHAMFPPDPCDISLGERALRLAIAELGVHETPGPATTARVHEYLAGCVRSGHPLGLQGDEPAWCAAFAGWCDHHAALPGETPPEWRAAVAECWADGAKTGRARPRTYRPAPGDKAIFARAGGDPRFGGAGHIARVESVEVETFAAIGGNEGGPAHHGGEVMRTAHRFDDPAIVGFIVS